MTFQSTNNLYGFPQSLTRVFPAPIVSQRNPAPTDFRYQIGQTWINEDLQNAWVLVDVAGNSAVWALTAAEGGTIETLTTDSGVVTPISDNVNIFGTANQISTSGSGATATYSIPTTFIPPGTLQVNGLTTLAALTQAGACQINVTGTGQTAIGNASAGNVTVTSGGLVSLSSTGGNINLDTTSPGSTIQMGVTNVTQNINIGTGPGQKTVALGTTNTSSTTTISSGSGGVNVNTTGTGPVTIGNDLAGLIVINSGVAGLQLNPTGDGQISIGAADGGPIVMASSSDVTIFSNGGDVFLAAQNTGNVVVQSADLQLLSQVQIQIQGNDPLDSIGTVTLTAGGGSVGNTGIVANDRIFLSRITPNASTAIGTLIYTIAPGVGFDIFSVDPNSPGSDVTADVSTIAYVIIRQLP